MKLHIEKEVYGGAGLARQQNGDGAGRTIFVPFTLPGETVEVALASGKGGFGEAELIEVLDPSPHRVKPRCVQFGTCGGCQYQHADYAAQVGIKATLLSEILQHAGLHSLPDAQVHTADQWFYRNRSQLRLEEVGGVLRAGYNRRGSNEFCPIQECPVLAPLLWRATEAVIQIAKENSAVGRWLHGADLVELFTDATETKLQMSFFAKKDQKGFDDVCETLVKSVPELAGVGAFLLSPQRKMSRSIGSWRAEGLNYQVAEERYWVSRGGFFQVNRFLVDELLEIVTSGRKGNLAWDLYAGVGLFSRGLAQTFGQVVAVEAVASDLQKTFKGAGKRAVEANTVDFLRGAVVQRDRPDLIVMDPPRAGVGREVCTLLARLSAAEIVYVSCDPVTLAADLKMLVEAGYHVAELHMIDLFPQTFHLESVVILRK